MLLLCVPNLLFKHEDPTEACDQVSLPTEDGRMGAFLILNML